MNDLLKSALSRIPRYFADLMEVTVNPKPFLISKSEDKEEELTNAFVFYGITALIILILQYPMLPKALSISDYLSSSLVVLILINGLTMFMCTLSLRLSWRAVGGVATLRQIFICTAYAVAPCTFIVLIFVIVGNVLFLLVDPVGAAAIRDATLPALLKYGKAHPEWRVDEIFIMIGLLAGLLWSLRTWGAYRVINKTSRFRSVLAYLLNALISIPLLFLTFLLLIFQMMAINKNFTA